MLEVQENDRSHDQNPIPSSLGRVIRRRYLWFLGLLGVTGVADFVKEYVRNRIVDYVVDRLGWFGDSMRHNPVAFTEIGIVIALVALTIMVTSDSAKEQPSLIYRDYHVPFMKPPASKRWIFGFVFVMLVIIGVVSFAAYKHWVHAYEIAKPSSSPSDKAQQIIAPATIPTSAPSARAKVIPKMSHSATQSNPRTKQEASQTPQGPAQNMAQVPQNADTAVAPQSQSVELTSGDRERLSNLYYEFAQMLGQMTAVGSRANMLILQTAGAIQNGTIVSDYQSRITSLRRVNADADALEHKFMDTRGKADWQYYVKEMNFVFGDDPDNPGMNAIMNATTEMANKLEQWSKLSDKETPQALNLLETPSNDAQVHLKTFFAWRDTAESRLAQRKASLKL